MRVYLARHGETTWNRVGRYQGRLESPLSELGARQAAALADAMAGAGIRRVISSPLQRCVETARPTALRLHVPVETDERLIEIAHGTWENRLRDEIAANDPERYRAWRGDPANVSFENGESIRDVLERWRTFAASFRTTVPALIVSHDAVVRVALVDALRRPLERFWETRVQNAGYAVLDVDESGTWTVVEEHVEAHLEGVRASIEGQAL